MSSSFTSDLSLVNLFYFNNHNNHPVDLLVGEIIIWPTNSNYPKGFLLCDGESYTRTDYNELYSVINYTYGGSGLNFNVPDFDDKHIRAGNIQGNNIQVGGTGGDNTISVDNLPVHTHSISTNCSYSKGNLNYSRTMSISANTNTVHTYYWYEDTGPANSVGKAGTDSDRRPFRGHTHEVLYNDTIEYSNQFANTTNIDSNNVSGGNLQVSYGVDETFGSPSSPSGQESYVPKSKKVYYLIYSGKH